MEEKKEVRLNEIERDELNEGQALYEMTKTAGFEILRKKLEDLGFHSWVDPRNAPNQKEWEWRELNGFHAANVAKELLEWIQKSISHSEYLEKKKRGEIKIQAMKI